MAKVYFALFVGIICVSLASIIIKLITDVPSSVVATYRLIISSIMLVSYYLFKNKKLPKLSSKDWFMAFLGGIFLSAHFIFWISSIKYTSIPSSVTLVATSPIFVGLFSYFVLNEKHDILMIAGIVLSVAGSIILTSSDGGLLFDNLNKTALLGDILAILGAVSVSGYFLVGSYLRRNIDILSYITLVYSFAGVISFLFTIFTSQAMFGYSKLSYFYMVLLAVVPQLLGHTSFNWALKYAKTSAVAVATLGEPVGATILAYIIFKESVNLMQGIGILIILISIFIASVKAKK